MKIGIFGKEKETLQHMMGRLVVMYGIEKSKKHVFAGIKQLKNVGQFK